MAQLAHIWRHPIKSHGHEAIERASLIPGQGLPLDRVWAVIHANSQVDVAAPAWASCRNFVIGADVVGLGAISAETGADGRITLRHPSRDLITLDLDDAADQARLLEWSKPLIPADRPAATAVVRLQNHGVFDTDFASISLNNLASLGALSAQAGQSMDMRRFRGNLWVDGLDAWAEHSWCGRSLRIGTASFQVVEPIARCAATTVNPKTAVADVQTPYLLRKHWGHRDFGVYLRVLEAGDIALHDELVLL
ncbi:MAG: MOSC domain-containing protein [Paracoccaceae bacterium]